MEPLVVRKSKTHQLLLLLAGALLIVAALDVMSFHWVSSPPEVDDESGEVNSTGRTQERADVLWGSLLAVAGAGLVLAGAAGLAWRQPVAVVDEDGLRLRVAGPRAMVRIPWRDVAWVHSGSDGDDEAVPTRVFLVHVADREGYPARPWGAAWDGDTLMIDALNWTMPPADVVIHANVALTEWRRHHDLEAGGPGPEPEEPARVEG